MLLWHPRPGDGNPLGHSGQSQQESFDSREYGILWNAAFSSKCDTDITTVTHAPGAQAQVRAKVTALGDLSRLNSAISVFPPSVPQLSETTLVSGNDRTCARLTLQPQPHRNTFQTLHSWTLPPISLPHSPTRARQVIGRHQMRQRGTRLNESMKFIPKAAGQEQAEAVFRCNRCHHVFQC